MEIKSLLNSFMKQINDQAPLIHHMTNAVTVNDCANITLATGARPVMAEEKEDAVEMVQAAGALILNIGTLNHQTIESMLAAGKIANQNNVPVLLDPVGAGATSLRKKALNQLLGDIQFSVIRGNISEMKAIAGVEVKQSGVDAHESITEEATSIGETIAGKYGCVSAISGASDFICDSRRSLRIEGGDPLMANVTGTGCMSTSVIGACCAVADNPAEAAAAGTALMACAGQRAKQRLKVDEGTGSYRTRLIDAISLFYQDPEFHSGGRIYDV